MKEISPTFLFKNTSYYFSYSELIDYYLGKSCNHSLQATLNHLEQQKINPTNLLSLFSGLVKQEKEQLVIDDNSVRKLIDNDGVKLLLSCLAKQLDTLQEKQGDNLANQIALKTIMNCLYICCDFLERNPTHSLSSEELNQLYLDAKIDDLLMKMVTLSLEVHYIPVKKLTMLYTKILANIFHHGHKASEKIHPLYVYLTEDAQLLPNDNLLKTGELDKLKSKQPPSQSRSNKQKHSPIELFYRKHNTGDCPLAQSIVVGLLRSLLTICNCQNHKKFATIKGTGVDSFRQWQLSYRWALSNNDLLSQLPENLKNRLNAYETFDQQPTTDSEIWSEFYSHKIYTTAAITSFFFLLLIAFKHNQFMQYSYFLQLISDANGILVFLKFLTDKFTALDLIQQQPIFTNRAQTDPSFGFKQKTMLTIYSVLLMLYTSCNNYPEKIRNYLFQYNSYLIIKKIPALFMGKENRIRVSSNKEEEPAESAPSNLLPSRKQLEQLEKQKGGCGVPILLKLTQLCFDLLKIQIPFFSKKMKQNAANMRLIIDLYCKFPKQVSPVVLSPLEKLFLKSKCGATKQEKFITSVQEMKTMHNQYNNSYYWSNDFVQEIPPPSARILKNLEPLTDPETWLEENMWKYYD